jgi:hypothetical protein
MGELVRVLARLRSEGDGDGGVTMLIVSRFLAEPSAKRVVTVLYTVLALCVFAFLLTMILPTMIASH